MRQFKVFYSIESLNRDVPSDKPIDMAEADIYSKLLAAVNAEGDFVGLIDRRDTTLQLAYEAEAGTYWVEIPEPDRGGSFGASLSFDQMLTLFKALPDTFSREMIPGGQFEAW